MSEPKFTLGPWIVGKDAPDVNYQSEDRLPDGWQTITGRFPPFAFGRCVAHVAEGNDATLIAAAPDMYEALKALLSEIDIHGRINSPSQDADYIWLGDASGVVRVGDVRAARAALAKARGETP